MKIVIVGMGYVGLSNAILLAQNNQVIAFDISSKKIQMLNSGCSPIEDDEIKEFLTHKNLNFKAISDPAEAYKAADYVIICTPTNFDERKKQFDTSTIETVIQQLVYLNVEATIVIKSTVPVGYTEGIRKRYNLERILYSPEFLREGKALYDNLYPSRIVVGGCPKSACKFAKLLKDGALKHDVPILFTSLTEAEAIKLFSNAYLALRVAFFNELDTYAEVKKLDTKQIIEGVCLDSRIGMYYNNPSFGYGGYCLPKDTKQLLADYNQVPSSLISAIVSANSIRKNYIADSIMAQNPCSVGIFRLTMKANSDNFRNSSVFDIMELLSIRGILIYIYEPMLDCSTHHCGLVVKDLKHFKDVSDIIICNRWDKALDDVKCKVYTRDLFSRD